MLFKQSLNRMLIGLARWLTPVLTWKNTTFVFRAADVHEVLSRNEDFTIAEINGENIARHIGPFILGMDDGPQYQRDTGILRSAVKKEDTETIRHLIRQTSNELAANLNGEFDIVSAYTRMVPLRLLEHYFGVPGPDDDTMLHWNRSIFWDIFLDLKDDQKIRKAALKSSKEMNIYLTELIKERKQQLAAGKAIDDNMLNRLIKMQDSNAPSFSDTELRGNIAGVYMGALEPTSKACVNILRQFYARKKVLQQAQQAARADDVETMGQLALEAMRFQPNMPLLMRYCAHEQRIGKKNRRIKAGKTVYAMTYSAMFDPRAVDNPGRFESGRPKDQFLYYGMGQHQCFGNYINFISIPEMLVALLKIEGLRPAKGKAGKVVFEGPFPDKWVFVKK